VKRILAFLLHGLRTSAWDLLCEGVPPGARTPGYAGPNADADAGSAGPSVLDADADLDAEIPENFLIQNDSDNTDSDGWKLQPREQASLVDLLHTRSVPFVTRAEQSNLIQMLGFETADHLTIAIDDNGARFFRAWNFYRSYLLSHSRGNLSGYLALQRKKFTEYAEGTTADAAGRSGLAGGASAGSAQKSNDILINADSATSAMSEIGLLNSTDLNSFSSSLSSEDLCWALHSSEQDVILDKILFRTGDSSVMIIRPGNRAGAAGATGEKRGDDLFGKADNLFGKADNLYGSADDDEDAPESAVAATEDQVSFAFLI
jgi:hypothetical protein